MVRSPRLLFKEGALSTLCLFKEKILLVITLSIFNLWLNYFCLKKSIMLLLISFLKRYFKLQNFNDHAYLGPVLGPHNFENLWIMGSCGPYDIFST